MQMPVMSGIALLKALKERDHVLPTIVITAHGTIETAVEAMKNGAVDYIIRPFEMKTVELAVTRALTLGKVERENRFLKAEIAQGWQEFIGTSPKMQELYRLISKISTSNSSVLITGETGTGKELVARAIHNGSERKGLFVPINCAAIPESMLESELFGHVKGAFTGAHTERIGKFEVSDGGTLFLDEINGMPFDLQAKLLRVIQGNSVERLGSNHSIEMDLRIISAMNCDPQDAISERRLREDLYYRLNVIRINVPPLRERPQDIPLMIEYFISKHGQANRNYSLGLDGPTMEKLCAYTWPGNVRELENLVERALVLCKDEDISYGLLREISLSPAEKRQSVTPPQETLALQAHINALEKQLIGAALETSEGNKAKASRLLAISERSLWYKIKKYGINQ